MVRALLCMTVVIGLMLAMLPAHPDGEPTASLSNSGVIAPIDEPRAHVLDQKVTITLPAPIDRTSKTGPRPAIIRVEYLLQAEGGAPLSISLGWPSTHYSGGYTHAALSKELRPLIKLDGKPVAWTLLTSYDLADQMWRPQIEKLLDARPALKERVLAIRQEGAPYGSYWMANAGVGKLKQWMEGQGLLKPGQDSADDIVVGLLGHGEKSVYGFGGWEQQAALRWLDPSHKIVDTHEILRRRWGVHSLLLDPKSQQLTDVEGDLLGKPSFGVFRFPLTIQPGKNHKLIVQYGQYLGWVSGQDPWHGMVYLMSPAKRWGQWDHTRIEVRAPVAWGKVALRPPPGKVEVVGEYRVCTIDVKGRPAEDLFISVSRPAGADRQRMDSE